MTDREIAEAMAFVERGRAAWSIATRHITEAERESIRPHIAEICAYLGSLLMS